LPVHVTSHAHELLHETPRHDAGPEHATSHGPGPHCTFWHDCLPLHSTLHDVDSWQLMPLRHALSVLHRMSHLYPAGHVTVFEQLVSWQLIVHVFWVTLHDEQPGGQLFASPPGFGASMRGASIEPATMQNPLSQTRPLSQSAVDVHAYWSLRWLIEQLVATAVTAMVTATSAVASRTLIAHLRS
jgi:hypothetical protein